MARGMKPGTTNAGSFKPGNQMGRGPNPLPTEVKEMRRSGRDILIRVITECEGMTRDQLEKALLKPKLTIVEEYVINGYLKPDKDIIRECQSRVYGKSSDSNKIFNDEIPDSSPTFNVILKKDYEMVDLNTDTGLENEV
jgi:hypothetical protein